MSELFSGCNSFLNQALEYIDIDQDTRETLRQPQLSLKVSVPVRLLCDRTVAGKTFHGGR
jgi:hypothetical protein